MEKDFWLVQQVREGKASLLLRIYSWNKPAVSVGRRQSLNDLPSDLLKMPLVRRPTGGGAVVHTVEESTYALAVSRGELPEGIHLKRLTEELYRLLRELLIERGAVSDEELSLAGEGSGPYTLCFSAPVEGDLLYRGRKVGGAALRAWRETVLLQGSLQGLPVPKSLLEEVLVSAVESLFLRNVRKERFELSRAKPTGF